MRSAVLQKAENKNQSMITTSSKRNADASLVESHEMPFGITGGPAFDFGKINVYDTKSAIKVQPKLTINQPGDKYEQEADAMADKVIRMSDNESLSSTSNIPVQRKCAECEKEEEEKIHRKPLSSQVTPFIQKKGEQGGIAGEFISNRIQSTKGRGNTLPKSTRDFMENRFDTKFSDVRIHTGTYATQMAKILNAQAFTIGKDIYFNEGKFSPETGKGKHLLAHELTHVLQQNKGDKAIKRIIQRVIDPEAQELPDMPRQSIMQMGTIGLPISMDYETGKALVREFNQRLADVATKVIPLPEDSNISSASDENREGIIQAFPDVSSTTDTLIQRAGSNRRVNWEGGVVGSLQVCFDFCTGNVRVVGWIWGGAGIEVFGGWYGAFVFAEKEFYRGNPGLGHFNCGTCDPNCSTAEHGTTQWGGGVAPFPIVIRPGERARFSRAGVEIGLLISPHSLCDADLEIIALLNLLEYAGPFGAVITRFADAANVVASRFGSHIECQLGIDVSGIVNLCRGVNGGITTNRAEICGGGYVTCGLGLSRDRNSLPH